MFEEESREASPAEDTEFINHVINYDAGTHNRGRYTLLSFLCESDAHSSQTPSPGVLPRWAVWLRPSLILLQGAEGHGQTHMRKLIVKGARQSGRKRIFVRPDDATVGVFRPSRCAPCEVQPEISAMRRKRFNMRSENG